jgi:hypothetical protein
MRSGSDVNSMTTSNNDDDFNDIVILTDLEVSYFSITKPRKNIFSFIHRFEPDKKLTNACSFKYLYLKDPD